MVSVTLKGIKRPRRTVSKMEYIKLKNIVRLHIK